MKKKDNVSKNKKIKSLANKKLLWGFLGVLIIFGTLIGVLIPILNKKNITEHKIFSHKAQTFLLLNNSKNSDFTIENKNRILPSQYKNKNNFLNILKTKFKMINKSDQSKMLSILNDANVIFKPNDQIGTLEFIIMIDKISKTFIIDGFMSINRINQKIDAEVRKKTMPTIKSESYWKKAEMISIQDIEITASDSDLNSKIINVKPVKSFFAKISGTTVVVTIEVTSSINGTKMTRYKVLLGGFIRSSSNNFFLHILKKMKNKDFKIDNKENVLASNPENINFIKNTIKNGINLIDNDHFNVDEKEKKVEIDLFNEDIDNKMKITFNANDKIGVLQFKVCLGTTEKEFRISGFKIVN